MLQEKLYLRGGAGQGKEEVNQESCFKKHLNLSLIPQAPLKSKFY